MVVWVILEVHVYIPFKSFRVLPCWKECVLWVKHVEMDSNVILCGLVLLIQKKKNRRDFK